ncbi:hypothetical protein FQN60_005576, partial [Etheostoma spectabile]
MLALSQLPSTLSGDMTLNSPIVHVAAHPVRLYNEASPQLNLTHLVHRRRRTRDAACSLQPVPPLNRAGRLRREREGNNSFVPRRSSHRIEDIKTADLELDTPEEDIPSNLNSRPWVRGWAAMESAGRGFSLCTADAAMWRAVLSHPVPSVVVEAHRDSCHFTHQ